MTIHFRYEVTLCRDEASFSDPTAKRLSALLDVYTIDYQGVESVQKSGALLTLPEVVFRPLLRFTEEGTCSFYLHVKIIKVR